MSRSISQQPPVEPLLASEALSESTRTTWRDYIEITKPGINKSNLFATFTGFWFASGLDYFNFFLLFWTLLGASLVIAGSCTLNNYFDRDIDPLMERTKKRAVPQGKISPGVAMWYGITLSSIGIIILYYGVNLLSALLGLIGFFVYVVIYTLWLKRVSTLNTVVGSISGAIPPMIGWVAVTGHLNPEAWSLFLILFMWQPPHFFALAMVKVEDYRAANIPMLPVVKSFLETKIQTVVFTVLLVFSSFSFVVFREMGWLYLSIAMTLGITYIILSILGFWAKDDLKWARQMFLYSLVYLPILLLSLIIEALV